MVELTILMPSLNEAETIGICVRKAKSFLERSGVSGEVLIADNGSTDGSQDIARELGARVVHAEQRGYGAALITGINAAEGRFIIMGDSDDSYDFESLMPFVEELRRGTDLVMGNRFAGGIAADAMPALHRYLGNPVLSFVGRTFFNTPVRDFHCGLRGFSRESVLGLGLISPGMEFASEMVAKASLFGLRITEVPTTLKPDGRTRPPHLRSWRDGWRHLKLLLSYAPHWLFLYPGIVMVAVGAPLFLALLTGPISIFGARLDIAALILAMALAITGSQMVYFYALARLHAVRQGILPATPGFRRLESEVNVDRACAVGAVMMFTGIIAAFTAVGYWLGAGLGDLDPSVIIRPAALSVAGLALGAQTITSGFLWGILDTRRQMHL